MHLHTKAANSGHQTKPCIVTFLHSSSSIHASINVHAGLNRSLSHLPWFTDYFLLPPTAQHPRVWWSSTFHQPSFVPSAASRAAWTAAEEDLHLTFNSTAQVATRCDTLSCNLVTIYTNLVPSAPTPAPRWIHTVAHRPRRSLSAKTPTLHIAVLLRPTPASLYLCLYLCLRYRLTFREMDTTIADQYPLLVQAPRPTM